MKRIDIFPEAMDIMVLNDLDRPRRFAPTLAGLRSATVQVLDTAARALDITRAAAHAELWPMAVRVIQECGVSTPGDHRHRAAYLECLQMQTRQDSQRVHAYLTHLTDPLARVSDTRMRYYALRLLTGAVKWLPIIGEPGQHADDALAREELPLGLLMLDALAERGVTNTFIGSLGGSAPEGVTVQFPTGSIYIGTDEEIVSCPPHATSGLLVDARGEDFTLIHDSVGTPVTPALISDVADLVTEFARGERLL